MNRLDQSVDALARACPPLGRLARRLVERERRRRYWRYRTALTVACPDNAFLPRAPGAGQIADGCQTMHNGLRVHYGSYHYFPEQMHAILRANRGVHEPQEERAFAEVLPHVAPGGAILELGACWAFYSLWFVTRVPDGKAFLIEADPNCLVQGERNFELNGKTAHRTHAWVGAHSGRAPNGDPLVCIDDFAVTHQLDRIAILHSDIQGAELDMLKGAERTLRAGRVDYLFISTHGDDLHDACAKFLEERGYTVIASANVSQSYSADGVLVAKRATLPAPGFIPLARR
ncbi:MAG TPA: FkbM family methyltransferase [Opitutales bacterium]|nr:FkbM family methyltransferase [Opitutales bacterium]